LRTKLLEKGDDVRTEPRSGPLGFSLLISLVFVSFVSALGDEIGMNPSHLTQSLDTVTRTGGLGISQLTNAKIINVTRQMPRNESVDSCVNSLTP
jgi:hypothetical protein